MDKGQDLFREIDRHLLGDDKPSDYLSQLDADGLLNDAPLDMLSNLKKAEQSPKYHPEGNAWNHTLLVVDEAARHKTESLDPRAFLWAALLHDIGKPETTRYRKGKITSYDHEKVGAGMAGDFLRCFTDDTALIDQVVALIRYHMQILHVVKSLPFAEVKAMKAQTDVKEVALLGLCDRMGRTGADREVEEENIRLFLQKCRETG